MLLGYFFPGKLELIKYHWQVFSLNKQCNWSHEIGILGLDYIRKIPIKASESIKHLLQYRSIIKVRGIDLMTDE